MPVAATKGAAYTDTATGLVRVVHPLWWYVVPAALSPPSFVLLLHVGSLNPKPSPCAAAHRGKWLHHNLNPECSSIPI